MTEARDFAIKAHGDQKYGTDKPYVVHLDAVASILREFGYDNQGIQDAAYLHDVLEDTQIKFDELADQFGVHVSRIVKFCTDLPGYPNRRTRKAATYAKMRQQIDEYSFDALPEWLWDAVRVKLADRLANIRACWENRPDLWQMYEKERVAFGLALHSPGVCDRMWMEYERLLSRPPSNMDKAVRQQEQVAGFGGSEVSTLTSADAVIPGDLK